MKSKSGKGGAVGWIARLVVARAWLKPSHRARREGKDPSSPEPGDLPVFSAGVSLGILIFFSLAFVAWGLFAFSTIGSKWPPPWNFGIIEDLPGASVYSTGVGTRFGAEPKRFQPRPEVQHVRGKSMPAPLETGR